MKYSVVALRFILLFLLSVCCFAQTPVSQPGPKSGQHTPIMPLSEVRAGMHGTAYTVFEGVKPEPMDLEILGVLKNVNGPRTDLILVRLLGSKPEYTGVVAGMSGSPVYVDGKLVGALSYRIGAFSKEPIGGVTPIEQMLEINEFDRSQPARGVAPATSAQPAASTTSAPGQADSSLGSNDITRILKPIEAPLVFSGFSEEAVRQFSPQFAALGLTPVMGAGSVTDEKQPEPIEPGSAVSMVLVRGDLDIAATCTVTYTDDDRLLACGHPVLQFGAVDIPMNKARVIATLASPLNSFKIINTTEPVGSFVQDRHTGILGRFGQNPEMIPVTLSVHGTPQPREYHYEVLNNPQLTPLAMMATLFSALQNANDYGSEVTYHINGKIHVDGYPDISLQNMFAPADGGSPAALGAALLLGDRFNRIFDNPFSRPKVEGVNLEFDVVPDRRTAHLETARTDVTEARPGDEIVVEAVLRPYRGERIVRRIPIKVPTSAPQGTLRILVSDSEALDRMRRIYSSFSQRLDLGSTIALLNKEHANNHLYVSILEPNPQAMIDDKVMPSLPLSVMNVMEGLRGTQDMLVVGESAVSEASTPLDYVVSGSQVISVTIK
ncbi:MAG TPA: SpoIVB peptidase S55 domain-containing protein [Terriglobales bacterium]|nr:SpoIVB peptidase S55 domain-containing protein [Terriglobales bacterium]